MRGSRRGVQSSAIRTKGSANAASGASIKRRARCPATCPDTNWGSSMRATSRTNIGLGVFVLNPSERATKSRTHNTRLKFSLANDPADEVQFHSGERAAELLHRTAVRERAEVERDQASRIDKSGHERLGIAIVS